jgi:ferredoxin
VRVAIDTSRCQGHGRCYDLAPSLFTDDYRGHGIVIDDGIVSEAEMEDARQAIRACPEQAVTIVADSDS